MKKLLIGSVALLILVGTTQFIANSANNNVTKASIAGSKAKHSGRVEQGKVSALTLNRFNRDFYNVTEAVWEQSKSLDKVTFVKDGSKMVAYYNPASRLVGTSTVTVSGGMSDQALTDIKTKYEDYSIKSVIFYDKNEANAISKLIYGTKLAEENYLVELSNAQKTIVVEVKVKGKTATINQI